MNDTQAYRVRCRVCGKLYVNPKDCKCAPIPGTFDESLFEGPPWCGTEYEAKALVNRIGDMYGWPADAVVEKEGRTVLDDGAGEAVAQ